MAKRSEDYNLEVINPSLAEQWHHTKNGELTPKDVTPSSGKKVWWICSKGHEWQAVIAQRNLGNGCPYCAGKLVCEDSCLQTINPTLAKQWHPTKNGKLTPKDVLPYSKRKVWWVCERKHEWQAIIKDRSFGNGCPHCPKSVYKGNLDTVNPILAKQWHPTKNGSLTPRDVTPGFKRKVWWVCEKGHEWQARIFSRNRGRGCPYCSGLKKDKTR